MNNIMGNNGERWTMIVPVSSSGILSDIRRFLFGKQESDADEERRLWRDYHVISGLLLDFYGRQGARNREIKYADGSNLADNLFAEGTALGMISRIHKEMK